MGGKRERRGREGRKEGENEKGKEGGRAMEEEQMGKTENER